jgi:signal transduction histidine kinase
MYTIKGRLLSAFLALGLLVVPFLIFSFISLKRINNVKNTREKVVAFNASRLEAQALFSRIRDYDLLSDDFYTQKSKTANVRDLESSFQKGFQALEALHGTHMTKNPVFKRRIDKLEQELSYLETLGGKILNLHKERGFRDHGLEGLMRKQIHQLETIEKGIELADVLSLRRREKDFFLRKDLEYVQQLDEDCAALIQKVKMKTAKASKNDLAALNKTLGILEAYRQIFGEIVILELEIGNEKTGLTQEWFKAGSRIDNEVANLYSIVNTDSNLLIGRIRAYIILLFGSTVVLAILLSIFIANRISRPIEGLIKDMDYIAQNQFKGTIKLQSSIKIEELHELTDTYNQLVKKIRRQLQVLGTQNVSLTRLNQKLTQSELELQEASQIKDKFFSIVSHDLRGHTGNIVSIAKILDQDKEEISAKEQSTFIQYLRESSQNLQMLLDNLLNWAKTQMNDHTLSPRAFDITQLLENNTRLFADHALRKGIHLTFDDSSVSRVYADKDMVDFVIRNLVSNALKFSRSGDQIALTAYESNAEVWVEISDTGVGMTQEQMDQLMTNIEENHSTKGTENEIGTGLGFAICRDFISRNGGQITIESELQSGSRFSFSVPTRITRNTLFRKRKKSE